MSWHFPRPIHLLFKQKLWRGPFHTGFFRPDQAAWITCLSASLHCCCLGCHTACSWALPSSCQDVDSVFGVSAQRCFSAMSFSTCARAAIFKFPMPSLFLASEILAANLQPIHLGGEERGNEKLQAKCYQNLPFHAVNFPVIRSFLHLPSDASEVTQYLGFPRLCMMASASVEWAGLTPRGRQARLLSGWPGQISSGIRHINKVCLLAWKE